MEEAMVLWTISELMHLTRDELCNLATTIERSMPHFEAVRPKGSMHLQVWTIFGVSWLGAIFTSKLAQNNRKPLPMSRQGRSELSEHNRMSIAKRFHPARSTAAPRRTLRRTLCRWCRFLFSRDDFVNDSLGCGYEKLALLVAREIGPFDPGLLGLLRREALRRLKALNLEADGRIDRNSVFDKKMQLMFCGKLLRRLLGKHRLAIEQHNASLEIFLGLELGIAGRIEGFDKRDLFGEKESLSDGDSLHDQSPVAGVN
jgi:hypothetical protein